MKPKSHTPANRFWKYLFGLLESLLALMLIVNLVTPDGAYSVVENRPLKSFPWPSVSGLVSGQSGKDLETYTSDQFVGRSTFFHINYLLRKAAGQREIQDVFLGKDALLQQVSLPDPAFLESQIHTLNAFGALIGIPCTVMAVPSAATIQPDKLPLQAPVNNINPALDQLYQGLQLQGADVRSVLSQHASEYIFYKTDHHWTSQGAMLAAQQLLATFGQNLDPQNFPMLQVSSHFEGTLASRTGSVGLSDDIYIAPDANHVEYVVTWADGHKTASIYDQEALERKDQYEVFLGSNQSLIHIETMADSSENLLLFKDSYANSMIQFLIPYYRNIYIVDPRYYYDDLTFLLSTGQITQCAFVFSVNNFMTERSLQDVLKACIETNTKTEEPADPAQPESESSQASASQEPPASSEGAPASSESAQGSEASSADSAGEPQPSEAPASSDHPEAGSAEASQNPKPASQQADPPAPEAGSEEAPA